MECHRRTRDTFRSCRQRAARAPWRTRDGVDDWRQTGRVPAPVLHERRAASRAKAHCCPWNESPKSETAPPSSERRAGRFSVRSRSDYRRYVLPCRDAETSASRSLRSRSGARSQPGAMPRISDTRVLNVPAVTSVGSALSVTHDSDARPVQDRNGAIRALRAMSWLSRGMSDMMAACKLVAHYRFSRSFTASAIRRPKGTDACGVRAPDRTSLCVATTASSRPRAAR